VAIKKKTITFFYFIFKVLSLKLDRRALLLFSVADFEPVDRFQEDEEAGEADGEDDDDDDGFFVPHGYLSDDEGAPEEEVGRQLRRLLCLNPSLFVSPEGLYKARAFFFSRD